jgi:glycosyltransferase involved in cell wall biosynthesis
MSMTAQFAADRNGPAFTVFTPTYNRAHTLNRVYESLRKQTCRDFEWLVVDDGSTDGTAELVIGWQRDADFPIRYILLPHAGKHVAHNRALDEARGTFFLVLDSDDACVPMALERMLYHWNTIPAEWREHFSGVAGLCCDQNGTIIGDQYPSEPLDISLREQHYVYGVRGEKWGADLTSILREHRFPEISGATFLPEGVIWLEIAKRFKMRCVNDVFRIYYQDDRRAGATLTRRKGLGDGALGRLYYYTWLLNNDLEYFSRSPIPFIKAAVLLPAMSLFAGQPLARAFSSLTSPFAKALVVLGLPTSLLLYAYDKVCTCLGKGYDD